MFTLFDYYIIVVCELRPHLHGFHDYWLMVHNMMRDDKNDPLSGQLLLAKKLFLHINCTHNLCLYSAMVKEKSTSGKVVKKTTITKTVTQTTVKVAAKKTAPKPKPVPKIKAPIKPKPNKSKESDALAKVAGQLLHASNVLRKQGK